MKTWKPNMLINNRVLWPVIFFAVFLLFLPSLIPAQITHYSTAPRSVRLPWPQDNNAWGYEVMIEAELNGAYRDHSREFTHESFIIVSLALGKYRYRVIPYNYLGRPEPEQSSAWRVFDVPAAVLYVETEDTPLVPEPDDMIVIPDLDEPIILPDLDERPTLPEPDDSINQPEPEVPPVVLSPESDKSIAQSVPEKPIEPQEGNERADRADRLWTLGASVGTSLYRPWLITTVHGTIAPLPYSFLEIGIDLGLVSGDPNASYYSLYPFVHYAFFMPFPVKGGWYIGAGGGYWVSTYSSSSETAVDNKFVIDFIAGCNMLNMIDISYTLRTNFKGISNKVSVGYVYRF
jgi:hypothetical protein